MARIRTIKPDFFRHEGLFEAEQETGFPLRLAFIGIWTVADRDGRFPWKPRALKLDALPFDVIDFDRVMDALERYGFILKYESDGKSFGWIPSWSKHQVINSRETKSVIPEPPDVIECTHVHAHACTGKGEHVPRGVNIPAPLRETVFARDGNACVRCHSIVDLTIDHIFPQCMGGTHALTNLRTLCRPCNSARPVQGQPLIDDLALDGIELGDMQRMCMHVHAQGEGKGREGKGREEEGKGKEARSPRVTPEARKTKIPDPFLVTVEMRKWAAERVPAVSLQLQTEKFVNYWRAEAKTKADWPATWRNWMLTAQGDAERIPRGNGPVNRQQQIEDANNDVVRQIREREAARVAGERGGSESPIDTGEIIIEGEFIYAP